MLSDKQSTKVDNGESLPVKTGNVDYLWDNSYVEMRKCKHLGKIIWFFAVMLMVVYWGSNTWAYHVMCSDEDSGLGAVCWRRYMRFPCRRWRIEYSRPREDVWLQRRPILDNKRTANSVRAWSENLDNINEKLRPICEVIWQQEKEMKIFLKFLLTF